MVAFVSAFSGALRPSAFNGARFSSRSAPARTARFSMEASPSVPFLERPPKLDGSAPGDVGFDPLGFSNAFSLDFLREAEIKHGRVCMLAMLGWVFPEMVYHLPNETYSQTNPLYAVSSVGWLPVIQILILIAALEAPSVAKVYENDCANPGDYGFDPFGMSKDAKKKAHYQLAEVKNGRLAMVAIGGAIHHALLTNVGLFEQITSGKWFGGYYLH